MNEKQRTTRISRNVIIDQNATIVTQTITDPAFRVATARRKELRSSTGTGNAQEEIEITLRTMNKQKQKNRQRLRNLLH